MRGKAISKKAKNIIQIVIIILCILVPLLSATSYRTFFVEYVEVKGASMEPTITTHGEKAKVKKNFYELQRRDIVVLFRSEDKDKYPISDSPAAEKNSFGSFCDNFASIFGKKFVEKQGYVCVIKRIIGLPNDTIQISKAKLYVNGELQNEDFILEDMIEHTGSAGVKDGIWILKENEYFVLGDNRNISHDSEDYGAIRGEQIFGKVMKISKM